MPTYRLLHTGTIERTDDDGTVWSIPPDPANRDYAEFLAWQDEHGVLTPEPAPAPPAPDPGTEAAQAFLAAEAPTYDDLVEQVRLLTERLISPADTPPAG